MKGLASTGLHIILPLLLALSLLSPFHNIYVNAVPAPTTPKPTNKPIAKPTAIPSRSPTARPTLEPSRLPSSVPTSKPTSYPTSIPTPVPSSVPTPAPSSEATAALSNLPADALKSGLSNDAIAGIVVCWVVLFCALVAAYFIWKRRPSTDGEDAVPVDGDITLNPMQEEEGGGQEEREGHGTYNPLQYQD